MTKKEALRIDNLILENKGLRTTLDLQFRVYSDTLAENVNLKARIETLREVMSWDIGEEYKNS